MGEASEEMIGGELFPTASIGASWIDGWIESVLVPVQGDGGRWAGNTFR